MNPDGTALRPLTSSEESEYSPAVSPDGKQIAYSRHGDIWVTNIDGGDQRPIAQAASKEHSPAWSPDGQRIAFVKGTPEGPRVYVMNADGSERAAGAPLRPFPATGCPGRADRGRRGAAGIFSRAARATTRPGQIRATGSARSSTASRAR